MGLVTEPTSTLKYQSFAEFTGRGGHKQDATDGPAGNLPVLSFGSSRLLDLRFLLRDKPSPACSEATVQLEMNNVSVLVGVSGCGKTSSVFELARTRHCIFFEAPSNGVLGSPDLRAVLDDVAALRGTTNDGTLIAEAQRLMQALVAARSLYLLAVLDKYESLAPLDWLLMQLPTIPLTSQRAPNAERFTHFQLLYTKLKAQPSSLFQLIIHKLQNHLGHTKVFCFLDEAHVLVEPSVSLPSGSPVKKGQAPRYRSPLSVLVQAVLLLSMRLVCAGTKLRLPDLTIVQSGISKVGDAERGPRAVAVTSFPFFNADEALQRLRTVVPPLRRVASFDVTVLAGRARLWASFADVLLHRFAQQAGTDDADADAISISEACLRDFVQFHVQGVELEAPLHDASRSLRYHFDEHLKQGRASPGKRSITLYTGLAELVTASLLALGDPRPVDMPMADWVSGGVCFLHTTEQGKSLLSCKEPLVLDAIAASVGVVALLDVVSDTLQRTKSLLGREDASKGILFQHLTVAQLLCEARGPTPTTMRALLTKWGVNTDKRNVSGWLQGAGDAVMRFAFASKDQSGEQAAVILKRHQDDRLLVMPNTARTEYLALAGCVLLTAGCKFYSKTVNAEFDDNEKTTDAETLFTTRDGAVNQSYAKQHARFRDELKEQLRAKRITHTLRLVFSVSPTMKLQHPRSFVTSTTRKIHGQTVSELIVTFTRANLADFFGADHQHVSLLLESLHPEAAMRS